MTLQKIADAVGVSVDTAHRVARDVVISDIGIENARGQLRPMHYAARAVEVEPDAPGCHCEALGRAVGDFSAHACIFSPHKPS